MNKDKYEVTKEVGEITPNIKIKLVKHNENIEKYDLRYWKSPNKPTKSGITLTKDQLRKFKEIVDHELCG